MRQGVAKARSSAKRLVMVYGELNQKPLFSSACTRNMEPTLKNIASCRYKTNMLKASTFWQVDLTSNARDFMAFITRHGCAFQWKVMPFGMANAPGLLH